MRKSLVKVVAVAASLALAGIMVAGCSGSPSSSSTSASASSSASSSASTEAETIETLVVGFDNSYPPYGYIGEDGEYTGLDLDLAQAVADRNGWTMTPYPIDWDAKDALLNEGTINCIWNGFTMEGREDDYTFSDPYMLNDQVVVVRADSGISSLADLADKVVITQIDSAAYDVLAGEEATHADLCATFKQLDTISDYNNAFMQLQAGTVDAVVCDLSIAAYNMSKTPDVYLQLDETLNPEHYAVGFAKTDEGAAIAEKVNEALADMVADGTAKEICDKYADQGVDYEANWVLK